MMGHDALYTMRTISPLLRNTVRGSACFFPSAAVLDLELGTELD
jgi:hypothetical protein